MARWHPKTRLMRILLGLVAGLVVITLAASLYVGLRFQARIVPLKDAPSAPVAIVFGAGLSQGQEPSPILAERLDAALTLTRAGKVQRLVLTGNAERYHDEPAAMRRYLVDRGVAPDRLILDGLGHSTYESCYRARAELKVERALLVTQAFHLPRALYLCNALGLEAYGVVADERDPDASDYLVREFFSRPWALVLVLLGGQ